MSSRREEERNEKIIRGLMKLPPNRRCINCNSLRARELYLKAWDSQRQRLPDNSNVDKIREFIKNVYVSKSYFVEKSSDRPPRDSQGLHEDETRRASSYHSFSQSPPYDFEYEERRYWKHAPALSRKPGSDRGIYEGKLSSFLSPSCSSDHANDDSSQKDTGSPQIIQLISQMRITRVMEEESCIHRDPHPREVLDQLIAIQHSSNQ